MIAVPGFPGHRERLKPAGEWPCQVAVSPGSDRVRLPCPTPARLWRVQDRLALPSSAAWVQVAVRPPSTGMVAPWMKLASSLAR